MGTITIIQFALIVVIVCYLTVNMLHIVKIQPVKGPLSLTPLISVCVPARNEARNIEACLCSLLEQDYPHFEVIAVDDHSSDSTGDIIKQVANKYPNLKFFHSESLPPDWYGKPFALHQAARKAEGEILLFTDADPVFEPHALTTAMHYMQTRSLDVLTLMPGTKFGSFWEKAVQPVIFALIAALTRFRKINSQEHPNAMGIGAFLMFKRSAYEAIGGHERVKQKVVEDIELGKCAKRAGFKLLIADGKAALSIRMYHSFKEIWFGWRKNIFTALKKSILWTFHYMGMILGFQVTPYAILIYNLIAGNSILWVGLSTAGALLVGITGFKLCEELKLAPHNIFWFPLGALVVSAIMVNSMIQSLVKKQTEWRGRIYKEADTAR